MYRSNAKWATFEARWRGEINHSSLVITKKTLNRKNRYELINWASYGVYIIMAIWFLLELRENLSNVASNGFNVGIVVPFIILLAVVSISQLLVNIYRAPYY
ncbi:MAG: hypothetical protein NUK65_09830, partial [Firmicutes bacterium]|nr:hypothetical protein [Bacillota bacterium]